MLSGIQERLEAWAAWVRSGGVQLSYARVRLAQGGVMRAPALMLPEDVVMRVDGAVARLRVRDAQMAQVLCLAYLQNRTLQEIARHERLGSRERARGVLRAAEAWVDACLFSLHAEQSVRP